MYELCEQCGREWHPFIEGGLHHRCPEWAARLEAMSAQWAVNDPNFVGPRPDNAMARLRRRIAAQNTESK
jgi:hypothetical protein